VLRRELLEQVEAENRQAMSGNAGSALEMLGTHVQAQPLISQSA
jgi:hypothetical protein